MDIFKKKKVDFDIRWFVLLSFIILFFLYFIFSNQEGVFTKASGSAFDSYWYACTTNDQCRPNLFIGDPGSTGVCLSGWCQACEADVECDSGESCVKGLCKNLVSGQSCGVGRCSFCDNNRNACHIAQCSLDDFNDNTNPATIGMGECWEPGGTADDKDSDGLLDTDESGVHITDSRKPDSDGGGMNDGNEIASGRNPNNSNDDGFVTGACNPAIGLFCGDPGSNCVSLGSGLSCIPSFRVNPPLLITDFDADGCPDWFEYNTGHSAHDSSDHPNIGDCRSVKNPPTGKVCSVNSNCPPMDSNLGINWACGPQFLCVPYDLDSAICGNGACETENGESEESCSMDCSATVCGDGLCSISESITGSCLVDCSTPMPVTPVCGDGVCAPGDCPADCTSPTPTPTPTPTPAPSPTPGSACGNSVCEGGLGENDFTCPQDCAVCGDGTCTPFAESSVSCPADCAVSSSGCGDGVCSVGEDFVNCSLDCSAPSCNNNGVCESSTGENVSSCGSDCGGASVCGNSSCEVPSENATTCPQDCSSSNFCGDGTCSSFENSLTCALDCGIDSDGDGLTDSEESAIGTNSNNSDTDGGGRDDGDEVRFHSTDPLDPADD